MLDIGNGRTRVDQLVEAGQLVEEGRAGAGRHRDSIIHIDSYLASRRLGVAVAKLALGRTGERDALRIARVEATPAALVASRRRAAG